MKDKIEEILKRNLSSAKTFELSMTGIYEELSTLIQQEREKSYLLGVKDGVETIQEGYDEVREEALRGFMEYAFGEEKDYWKTQMNDYLSQQREKGKE